MKRNPLGGAAEFEKAHQIITVVVVVVFIINNNNNKYFKIKYSFINNCKIVLKQEMQQFKCVCVLLHKYVSVCIVILTFFFFSCVQVAPALSIPADLEVQHLQSGSSDPWT